MRLELSPSAGYAPPAGEVFMIHTELAGEYTIRLAVGSATTQRRHIDQAWQLLCETATEVLAKQETA
jgi:aromatic-L-amino-acid decarboxylase